MALRAYTEYSEREEPQGLALAALPWCTHATLLAADKNNMATAHAYGRRAARREPTHYIHAACVCTAFPATDKKTSSSSSSSTQYYLIRQTQDEGVVVVMVVAMVAVSV